jgi:hypothetical protein
MNDASHHRHRISAKALWGSRIIAAVAILNAAFALFARWAVNAEAFGEHDLGRAIAFSFAGGASWLAAGFAAPALMLLALCAAFLHRKAALWLLAAAVVNAVPVAIYWR